LTDWTVANADLAATGGGAKTYDRLDVGDPDTNAGVDPFPKNTPAGDDNFAMKATATLVVPEDGTYVIGFNTDDGGYVKLAGKTFTDIVQNNTGLSAISGDTVTCDCLTGDSGTLATVTLTKGNYPIEFGQFEQGGGAFLAGRGAKQPANPVTTADIPFLTKGAAGSKIQTTAALQATSAPADAGGGGPGPGTGPTLTITRSGNNITITSSAPGTVQSKDALGTGTWTNVGAAPQTVPIGTGTKFFRVQAQ